MSRDRNPGVKHNHELLVGRHGAGGFLVTSLLQGDNPRTDPCASDLIRGQIHTEALTEEYGVTVLVSPVSSVK